MAQNFVLPAQYQGMTLDQLAQTWQQPNTDQVPMPPMQMQAPVAGPEMPSRVPAEVPFAPQPPQSRGITSDDLMNGYGRPKQEMIPDLRGQLMEALNKQKASSEDSANLFKNYLSGNQRMDNSALVSLLDRAGGNKTPTPYLKPANYDEYAMGLSKLQNTANDNQKGVLDSLVKMAGQKTQDKYMENLLRQQAREKNYDLKTREGLFKSFQGDKIATAAKEALKGAEDATALLNTNTPIGDEAFKLALARASGEKGPLSDTDIARWGGSPAYAQRIQRFLERADTGRLDEKDRQDMYLVIEAMKKRQSSALDSRRDYFAKRVGPKVYGVDPEASSFILGGGDPEIDTSLPSAVKPNKVPSPPGAAATPTAQAAPVTAPRPATMTDKDGKVWTKAADGKYY